MATSSLAHLTTKTTPQSEKIPGSNQVPNSAGGWSFEVDRWTRLQRFMCLGTEGGSYYASERKLTLDNFDSLLECLREDGLRVVGEIVAISEGGRAPKNDYAVFALAACFAHGDAATKTAAKAALPRVCRIGTHLFQFAQFVDGMRGWGRGLRRAVASWYETKDAGTLAYQAIKYQSRHKFSHRDLLRLSHPSRGYGRYDGEKGALYDWICGRNPEGGGAPALVQGYVALQELAADFFTPQVSDESTLDRSLGLDFDYNDFDYVAPQTPERAAATQKHLLGAARELIGSHKLPHEAVPSELLAHAETWDTLLHSGALPLGALVRNLGRMTANGLLAPGSAAVATVCARLADAEAIKKARLHPLALLVALKTYQQGQGVRGKLSWQPVTQIIDALDAAFYLAFGAVEPTNKRFLLALDVSGSMSCGEIAGMPGITPRIGSAAMALITAATEPAHKIMGFSHKFVPLSISPRQRLDDAIRAVSSIPFGGTDCALPMQWAAKHKVEIDTFVVYTDSETYFGRAGHPVQALKRYRETMGIPARLAVVGMLSNDISIADPNDAGTIDVCGFDLATPKLLADFSQGLI